MAYLLCRVVLASLFASAVGAQETQNWAAANAATRRLAVSAFPALPAPVRADLDRRGCTVPQPHSARQAANVIRGHFFGATSNDWAVLCSRGEFSSILVYRNGEISPAATPARDSDAGYLQSIRQGELLVLAGSD